jgi:serine/threonine-protein kinase RsbT
MQDGYTSGQGMGYGLPGAKRLVDDFVLQSEPGQGTSVRVAKWK